MKEALETYRPAKESIIVALDVETANEANEIVRELHGNVGAFKIGLQLFTGEGPRFVRQLVESGEKIFLDLKFHDIPNTVAKASAEAAKFGVWMFNVHASGGREMITRAVESVDEICTKQGIERPKIIGVTVLTSSNAETLKEQGISDQPESLVVRLAKMSADCGLDGVVASANEARSIRKNIDSKNFLIVTPGIRPNNATSDDQKRVNTPAEALSAGSDFLVIGRPITGSADKLATLRMIISEIETSLK